MLIRSIRADNFRRFERVEIEGLPEHGLIGLEGPNESGKSTLGELLLFAFFGRARAGPSVPVASLIRWGAESLRVEVEFLIRRTPYGDADELAKERAIEGGAAGGRVPRGDMERSAEYMIYREIDRRGSSFVKVLRLPGREDVAIGTRDTAKFIASEVRFDFEEFQRSFYHGQLDRSRWGDGAAPSDEAGFLEVATGIVHLRAAIQRAREAMRLEEEKFAHVQTELDRNRAQIERHDRNAQKIPALVERSAALEARIAEKKAGGSCRRDEVRALRSEAARFEARAAALEAAASATVLDLEESLRKAREEDRKACGERTGVHRKAPWAGLLETSAARLDRVELFVREYLDLGARVKERAEEIGEQLESEAAESAPGEYARRERDDARLGARLRRLRAIAWVTLVLTALAGAASIAVWQDLVSLAPDVYQLAIGVAGGVTGVLLFLSAWCLAQVSAAKQLRKDNRSSLDAARRAMDRLRAEHRELLSLVETAGVRDARSTLGRVCRIDDKRLRTRAEEFLERHRDILGTDEAGKGLESVLLDLAKQDRDLQGQLLDAAQKSKKKLSAYESALKKLTTDRDRVTSELRECRSQEKKKLAIHEKNFAVEVAANTAREEIARLRQAVDLLEETIVSIRTRARPAIVGYLKTVLPRLTGGRYRDLRVDDNLEISVFSSEKGDFLAVSELSGGTGEALGLSLRLALSQAFVKGRVGQAQFVFLDEPFKMMDGSRSVASLCALEELSADLRQIFVAQPRFDDTERALCRYLIRTDGGSERLYCLPCASGASRVEDDPDGGRPCESATSEAVDLDSPAPDRALGAAGRSFRDEAPPPTAVTNGESVGDSSADGKPAERVDRDSGDDVGSGSRSEREGQDVSK